MSYTMNVAKIKRMLLLTIGVMAAIMGYYIYIWNIKNHKFEPEPVTLETDADVVVNNFEVFETLNDRTLWTLRANIAEVYSARQETRLQDVEVDFFDENGKSLHIISDHGIRNDQTGDITASGNVQASAVHEDVTLNTDELFYNAETRKIISDRHVIIKQGNMITEGDGLETDLSLKKLRILRNNRTYFIPEE